MDQFKMEYNAERPHEALNMKTQNSVHSKSKRIYSDHKIKYDYPYHSKKMKITTKGAARWGAYHWIFISRGAVGRYVAAQEVGNGRWNVYCRNVLLGYFDEFDLVKKEQYLKLTQLKV